jgi:hypothetical protein
LGARGASEALLALAEDRGEWSASDEARLRSGSGDEDEEDDGETEPGRRSVRVRAVSSKSSPEAAEDSVELRSVSADMVGCRRRGMGERMLRCGGCRFRGGVGRESDSRYSGGVSGQVLQCLFCVSAPPFLVIRAIVFNSKYSSTNRFAVGIV